MHKKMMHDIMKKTVLCIFLFSLLTPPLFGGTFLFDASKAVVSGNADWVIDADAWDVYLEYYPCGQFANESNAQHIPSPSQSLITSGTSETYWTGGISAWAVDLVQAGHEVYTLPYGETITYNNGANPLDLSNFDVFIMPEPQLALSAAEKTALLNYINDGGALFMVADHQTSDRNCSGWDSPHVFNDFMGVVISSGVVTNYGYFGFVFNVEEISGLTSTDYWFTDGVDDNVTSDLSDPIIYGPFGDGIGGLGFFGATAMTKDTATNPTVKGHVWKTGVVSQGDTLVTFITAQYGSGRIAAIGDSSPADDGTGDSNDTLYDGWDKASGGVNNDIIHLNACDWLLNGNDIAAPVIETGPFSVPGDCYATITWTTDEVATSVVDFGLTASYGTTISDTTLTKDHEIIISPLNPGTLYHFMVSSSDSSGNGPTSSSDGMFSTTASQVPFFINDPSVTDVYSTSAIIEWTSDEPTTGTIAYGKTAGLGMVLTITDAAVFHRESLLNLDSGSLYYYQVTLYDTCGNGPIQSSLNTFTTSSAQLDISNYTVQQYDSSVTYTIPPGITLAPGDYVVISRNVDQGAFESFWGVTLGANVIFINSNEAGTCAGTNGCIPLINGGESYSLSDTAKTMIDGITISGSSSRAYQRIAADMPADQTGSWNNVDMTAATPGSGMSFSGNNRGLVISEWSDASSYAYEFVELYYDQESQTQPVPTLGRGIIGFIILLGSFTVLFLLRGRRFSPEDQDF